MKQKQRERIEEQYEQIRQIMQIHKDPIPLDADSDNEGSKEK